MEKTLYPNVEVRMRPFGRGEFGMYLLDGLRKNLVVIALSAFLMLAGAVSADNGKCRFPSESFGSNSRDIISESTGIFSSSQKQELASIGDEINEVSSISSILINESDCHLILPSAPAAFFMALTGFICITLVRDRMAWLKAVLLIVSLSIASVSSLPGLAIHLTDGNSVICKCVRPRQRRGKISVANNRKLILSLRQLAGVCKKHICQAKESGWIFCFSPAFTKDTYSHGPPAFSY